MKHIVLFYLTLCLLACSSKGLDYNSLESFDENNNLKAVIEIPAGTNEKIEYKSLRNVFELDTLNGKPRVIEFLPYPVNYGFIPSTRVNNSKTSDALDILVFGKPLKTGQIVTVRPIAILKMTDDGKSDHKILSIPLESKYQIIDISDFQDLSQNHPKIRDMIAEYFLCYDKNADIQVLGWSDENKALEEIKELKVLK